jgi:hypothetical protein
MPYDVDNPVPGLGKAQKCGRVKLDNENLTLSLIFKILVSYPLTYIMTFNL